MRRFIAVLFVGLCSSVIAQDQARTPQSDGAGKGGAPETLTNLKDHSPTAVAMARLRDAESVGKLTAEGRALASDPSYKSPDNYKYGKHVLAEKGEFRQAIRSASLALFLAPSQSGDWYSAFAKLGLATAYLYAGDLDSASKFASEVFGHSFWPSLRTGAFSAAHKILGDVALRRGEFPKAIKHYEDSIFFADDSHRFYSRAALASALVAANQFELAKGAIDKAEGYVDVLTKEAQPAAKSSLLRIQGMKSLREGKHIDAALFYDAALKEQRDGDDAAYDRFWLLEGLGQAKLAVGDKAAALRAYLASIDESEKVRSRFRSEEVKTGLFGDMQDVYGKAIELLMEAGKSEAAWEISERSRSRALLDMMRNRVALVSGKTAFADAFIRPTRVSDIAARLKPGEAVVTYHLLPDRAYAWTIRSSGIVATNIDVGLSTVASQVAEFRDAIVERRPNVKVIGAALYAKLVMPLGLTANESIVFVPHDALHYLPFQALWTGDKYLIQVAAVSYAPSGGALVHLAERSSVGSGKLLAMGNPDLEDHAMALPGAQREVEAIGAMYPGSDVYLLKEATKERFVQNAGLARVVHVAAHGTIDPLDPLYSKLELAKGAGKSGAIEAREVYGMKFDETALVVLSACDTGLGKVSHGDEVWGFTRSFLSAGTPALMVSLWPVSDESTEMLMKRFYSERKKGLDTRSALRTATLDVLTDTRFSQPFFWAPFNLVGDPR